MTIKIDLNSRGVAQVLSSAEVYAALRAEAEEVAARARASAPVNTGDYRNSIRVETGPSLIDGRARAIVLASAPHARVVEARTGNLSGSL